MILHNTVVFYPSHFSLPPSPSLFKTLCYNRLPSSRNEDGMVTLQFNKPDSVLMSQQETLVKELQTIVSAATVQVVVNTIRPLPDNWYIAQRYI